MKSFKEWRKYITQEGVQPTDMQSFKKDQDLDSIGDPWNQEEMDKLEKIRQEKDDVITDFQKAVFKAQNSEFGEDDPNNIKFDAKNPSKNTPKANTFAAKIDKLMSQQYKAFDAAREKEDKQRNEISEKLPSSMFLRPPQKLNSPNNDGKNTLKLADAIPGASEENKK